MSELVLLIVIAVIAIVVVAMCLFIIAMKGWRQARAERRRRRRLQIEPGVLKYLGSLEGGLGDYVALPLVGARREAAIEVLLDHADIVKGEAKARITAALEQIGMVEQEIARLESPSGWRRAAAAERLGLAGSHGAVESLARRLEDPDHEVRLRAARALGRIQGTMAVRPLIVALAQPTRWSTLRVADILSSMGGEAEEEVIRAFPGLPQPARLAALDILSKLRRPGSAAFLEQRLSDEDPDVRARAAHALGQIGDPTNWRALIRALRDPEWPVRAMAAKALGKLQHEEAIDALAETLRDRQWWVRTNSAMALREMGEKGTAALLKALDSPDDYARHQAVLMLQETGIVDRLVDQLARKEGPEAVQAYTLVAKLVRVGRTGRLEELSRTHRDAAVRKALAAMLPAGAPSGAGGAR